MGRAAAGRFDVWTDETPVRRDAHYARHAANPDNLTETLGELDVCPTRLPVEPTAGGR